MRYWEQLRLCEESLPPSGKSFKETTPMANKHRTWMRRITSPDGITYVAVGTPASSKQIRGRVFVPNGKSKAEHTAAICGMLADGRIPQFEAQRTRLEQ